MSANFRKIRPSFGDSSASASTPSQSTSESTGSDPRRNRGEKEIAEGSSASSKRRRVPESVTRNACLNCKKARAKCDGKKPCKRCATRVETSECIYEIHIKHAKEELVKQIKELRAKDHLTEQILQALSTDEKVPEILERLKNGEAYEAIVEWLGRSPMEDFETLSPRESQHSTFEPDDQEMGGMSNNSRWSTVTSDTAVLDHLFQLYFAWVHPVHTLFSEGHFVDSYKRHAGDFCSSTLVNAICAMACFLHTVTDNDEVEYDQLAREFGEAVRAEINPSDTSITTIQTFAVMFLVDSARGQGLSAASYLQIATTSLLDVKTQDADGGFEDVWKNTVRGVRNLNIEWAQVSFQVPLNVREAIYKDVEENDDKLDEAKWYCYRFVNEQCESWPGLLATTNREKAKLMMIIHDATTILYTRNTSSLSAHTILDLYSRYAAWREDFPIEIDNVDDGGNQALPHVLSLLILYEHSVVQLLRPLLEHEGFATSLVDEAIWTHAQQGLYLLDEHYRARYSCRYQPSLQMFSILHLSDVIARYSPGGFEGGSKDGPEAIQFGIDALTQSKIGFPLAGPLLELLRRTAVDCSIRIPPNPAELSIQPVPTQTYRMDDFINVCTRPTYLQPVHEIRMKYDSTLEADWRIEEVSHGFGQVGKSERGMRLPSAEERGAQSLMQIRNLLNTS